MLAKTLSTLKRTALAVAALSVISTAAHAGFSNAPDPFFGNSAGVDLQAAAGTLMTLPGVGPDGVTLYADNFHIGNFAIVASDVVGANLHVQYRANFHVDFLQADGTPAVGGFANLTGAGQSSPVPNGFHVTYENRNNVFQTGIFNMVLDTATFSGTSSIGGPLYVSLAGPSTGQVDISSTSGGYNITYLTPFTIQGQYTLNTDGSGTPTTVPPLGDTNGQPLSTVPEPSTLLLIVPGLLGLLANRRRRSALTVA
ncbi:MAG: PEP-CTERM sorting domain-containing protein [Candidatus Methylumidiphilus sp.]